MAAAAPSSSKPSKGKSKQSKADDDDEEAPLMVKGPYGPRINMPRVPQTKHKCELLPDGFLCIIIEGASGCGKSVMLGTILPWITGVKAVLINSLIIGNEVYKQVKSWCDEQDPPVEYHFAADPDTASEKIEYLANEIEYGKDECGVVVFDDFTAQQGSRDQYGRIADQESSTGRNAHLHCIFITQSPLNVPRRFLTNANVRVIFAINRFYDVREMTKDVLANVPKMSADELKRLYQKIQAEQYAYMWIVGKGKKSEVRYMLPSQCPDEKPILYRFENDDGASDGDKDTDFGLRTDTRMQQLVERYKKSLETKGVASRHETTRVRGFILGYAQYIASQHKVNAEDVIEKLEDIYELRLP
jgi:hypothetical protein